MTGAEKLQAAVKCLAIIWQCEFDWQDCLAVEVKNALS